MRLVGSKTSPYVRKIRVLLAEKGLDFEFIEDNVWSADAKAPRFNPLGKVPALVLDDGEALFDSVAIGEYLDEAGAPAFLAPPGLERARIRRDEALGDGIADAGIALFLERKREAARQDPAWMDRQRGKVDAGAAGLAKALGKNQWIRGDRLTLGDIACGCALFWTEFRLPEIRWREQHPNLKSWAERLESRPSFASTRPPG